MKTIGIILVGLLFMNGSPAWAQTNAPGKKAGEQQLFITSDSLHYDGITNQLVYLGHVFVTDKVKAWLHCEQLTADIPPSNDQPTNKAPNDSHPTNIVAEINVVIDVVDEKGVMDHITADKAVYSYHITPAFTNVVNTMKYVTSAATNEMITFSGGNPGPTYTRGPDTGGWADLIIIHIFGDKYKVDLSGHQQSRFLLKNLNQGTNGSPLDILNK